MNTNNLTRYRDSLATLLELGHEMFEDVRAAVAPPPARTKRSDSKSQTKAKAPRSFRANYQDWYTEAHAVLRQVLPDRVEEFESFYMPDAKRKGITLTSYTIQDWLSGIAPAPNSYGEKAFEEVGVVIMRYQMQLGILSSVETRFESSLFEIKQLVQADLFDSELEGARELLKSGFGRASGAIAGVVLEKHLRQVCENHKVPINKQHPTIADLNDLLKAGSVVDVPTWRQIQRLGDLRNLATHNRDREPTEDELSDLIDGTEKMSKTLY